MIYITGDCHGDWKRFSMDSFPEQQGMTRDDFVIVCGDFGLWNNDKTEKWWLKWLAEKNFTVLFVDGNHENFDRLYGDEFDIVDFYGGKAHKIQDNLYHLMRGYIFNICEKKIFAFGGAQSHDIRDGIMRAENFPNKKALMAAYNSRTKRGEMLRIDHISWWQQEMPSKEEMDFGLRNLVKNKNKVDYIISHGCPQQIASLCGYFKPDKLTEYFDTVYEKVDFSQWFFGHYHDNRQFFNKFIMLCEQILRIA